MKPTKQRGNFAFIDSQNLNLGVQKAGWKMDWRRFRKFLENKYNVSNAYMFIGHMTEHEDLYLKMHEAGYLVVLKPTQDLSKPQSEKEDEHKYIKGNVDADLVLWAMRELQNYDKAVIVSGDGDFYGLYEFLEQNRKLQNILTPNWQYSQLLKPFESYIVRLDQFKRELSYHDRNKKSS